MKFLKFKSDVQFLSSMLPSKLEPYRYFKYSDGYLLRECLCKSGPVDFA